MKAGEPVKRIACHTFGVGLALAGFFVGFYGVNENNTLSQIRDPARRAGRDHYLDARRRSVALDAINHYVEAEKRTQTGNLSLLLAASGRSVADQLETVKFRGESERLHFLLYLLSRSSTDLALPNQAHSLTVPFTEIGEIFSVSLSRALRRRCLETKYSESSYLGRLFQSLDTLTMYYLMASLLSLNDGGPEALGIELQICELLKGAPRSYIDGLKACLTSNTESISFLYSLSRSGRNLAKILCGYGRFPAETESHALYDLQFAELDKQPPLHLVASPNRFGNAFIGWIYNIPLPEPASYDFRWIASLPEEFRASAVSELLKRVGRVDPSGALELNSRIATELGITGNMYATVRDLIMLDPFEASGIILKLPPGSERQRLVTALLKQKNLSEAERHAWSELLNEPQTDSRSQ